MYKNAHLLTKLHVLLFGFLLEKMVLLLRELFIRGMEAPQFPFNGLELLYRATNVL